MAAVPRERALRILGQVLGEGRPLDDALADPALGADRALEGQGRAWLQDATSGTLRWLGRCDQVIDSIALKKKPTGWLRKALQLAVYQLLAQERAIPAGVVSETVDLVRKKEGEGPAKFANALLRKAADTAAQWRTLAAPVSSAGKAGPGGGATAGSAAQWASLPPWFWSRLVKDHGPDWAGAYAVASLERPRLWIRSRDAEVSGAEPGPIPGSFHVRDAARIDSREGFGEGRFFVQDISSQKLVHEIATLALPRLAQGARALDLCAAPGGKALGLAWSGFQVVATDRDGPRMRLLESSVQRAGEGRVQVLSRSEAVKGRYDLVWVDAPCTGSGIIRRHPDARWLKQEKELPGLAKIQMQLLTEGWDLVRPGGFLAYSVCSVFHEEGPGRLKEAALEGAEEVSRWLLSPQEAPHGDGFWGVLLHRRADAGAQ